LLFYNFAYESYKHGFYFRPMNSSNNRKRRTKARTRARVATRQETKRALQAEGNSIPSPNTPHTRPILFLKRVLCR